MPEAISSLTPQGIKLLQQQSDIRMREQRRKEASELIKLRLGEQQLATRRMDQDMVRLQEDVKQKELTRQSRVMEGEKDRQFAQEQAEAGRGFAREQGEEQKEFRNQEALESHTRGLEVMEKQAGIIKQQVTEEREYLDRVRREVQGSAIEIERLAAHSEFAKETRLAELQTAQIAAVADEQEAKQLTHKTVERYSDNLSGRVRQREFATETWGAVRERIGGGIGGVLSGLIVVPGKGKGPLGRQGVDLSGSTIPVGAFYRAALQEMGLPADAISTEASQRAEAEHAQFSQGVGRDSPLSMRAQRIATQSGREAGLAGAGKWGGRKDVEAGDVWESARLVAVKMLRLYETSLPLDKRNIVEGWAEGLTELLRHLERDGSGQNQGLEQILRETGSSDGLYEAVRQMQYLLEDVSQGVSLDLLPEGVGKENVAAIRGAAARLNNEVFRKLGVGLLSAAGSTSTLEAQMEGAKQLLRSLDGDFGKEEIDLMIRSLPPGQREMLDNLRRARGKFDKAAASREAAQEAGQMLRREVLEGELGSLDLLEQQLERENAGR